MAVSVIDGTLEGALLKRIRGKTRVYQSLQFRLRDGSSRSIAKAIVHEDVAALLEPGTSGCFYLYTAIDHRGISGVRDDRGRQAFAVSMVNEYAMLATVAIGTLLTIFYLTDNKVSFWGLLCIVLGIPGYFLYRQVRIDTTRHYQAHGGPAASTA
jgi:hypothetical protein